MDFNKIAKFIIFENHALRFSRLNIFPGFDAPWTGKMMNWVAPDGGGCCTDNSGPFDQLGFQTLTCTLDPIATPSAPTGLNGYVTSGAGQLSWWGSARASQYHVKRSATNGSGYVTIATVASGQEATYTDSGLTSGTYFYVISATVNGTETGNSNEVRIVYDTRQLQTYLTFNQAQGQIIDTGNGNLLADSSGNNNQIVLYGNATIIPGIRGNALRLDGASSYIAMPSNVINISDFTFATWVNFNSLSNWMYLFNFGYGLSRWHYFTPKNGDNGYVRFAATFIDNDSKFIVDTAGITLTTGVWYHLAVVQNGGSSTIYINGTVAASGYTYLPMWQLQNADDNPAEFYIGKSR